MTQKRHAKINSVEHLLPETALEEGAELLVLDTRLDELGPGDLHVPVGVHLAEDLDPLAVVVKVELAEDVVGLLHGRNHLVRTKLKPVRF